MKIVLLFHSYFLNLFLMKLHLYLKNVVKNLFVALLHSRRNRLATRTIGTSRRNKLLGVAGLILKAI